MLQQTVARKHSFLKTMKVSAKKQDIKQHQVVILEQKNTATNTQDPQNGLKSRMETTEKQSVNLIDQEKLLNRNKREKRGFVVVVLTINSTSENCETVTNGLTFKRSETQKERSVLMLQNVFTELLAENFPDLARDETPKSFKTLDETETG